MLNVFVKEMELLAKAESMKKKLPWLRYDMKQAEYREAKERENEAAKALKEAAKLLNDLKEPIKYDGLSDL
ncbi:structural maintenance-like chromosomes-protein [Sesbania bispinosa]|nr:structural maintenance-like chromosomes-protein [Sesbania bispinosa]